MPRFPSDPTRSIKARLLRFSTATDDGCLIWKRKARPDGFATIRVGSRQDDTRRMEYVHRVAYQVFVGPIPVGKDVSHTCQHHNCVKVEHLILQDIPLRIKKGWRTRVGEEAYPTS